MLLCLALAGKNVLGCDSLGRAGVDPSDSSEIYKQGSNNKQGESGEALFLFCMLSTDYSLLMKKMLFLIADKAYRVVLINTTNVVLQCHCFIYFSYNSPIIVHGMQHKLQIFGA